MSGGAEASPDITWWEYSVKIVYAKESRVIAFGGMRIALRPGDPWDGDDPLVAEHPDAFVSGPATVRSTREPAGFIKVPTEQDDQDKKPRTPRRGKASGE